MTICVSKRLTTRLQRKRNSNRVQYTLRFASIITPATLKNIRLLQSTSYDTKNSHNKVLVKQSYLLLT